MLKSIFIWYNNMIARFSDEAETRTASQDGQDSTGSLGSGWETFGTSAVDFNLGEVIATAPTPKPGSFDIATTGGNLWDMSFESPETDPAPDPEPTPVSDPEPAPAPAPDPVVGDDTTTDASDTGSPIAPTAIDVNGGAMDVAGGRVTTFALPDAASISNVTINNLPAEGNVTVNPDFTLSLVLSGSDYAGPLTFDYTVTHSDGTAKTHTANLDVATPTQAAGWALGNHYMLETDGNDRIVVEHGDTHRKVYVSNSEDALTRSDIAALEDVAESVITTQWLRNNPEYGGFGEMALAEDLGMELWYDITAASEGPVSHWLLFERGFEYDNAGQIVTRGMTSESELHPVHITSWGEGERPVLNTKIQIWQEQSDNIVFTDLAVTGGASVFTGDNILMSNMSFSEAGLNVRFVENFTFRNSEITDAISQTVPETGEIWESVAQGILVVGTDGVLMENSIFHHNGWQDDYLIDGDAAGGMAPNMYSHNVYIQYNTTDVTFRDNITSQSSGLGAHIRGGGFVENNLFLDNNTAVSLYGGNYKDFGFVSNFTLFTDNVVTSGGYKIAPRDGASAWGVQNTGSETTLLNNIIAHLSNPDDPDEQLHKTIAQMAINTENGGSVYYDDSIVLNWQGSEKSGTLADDRNLDGVDIPVAMATTIQRYAADLLDVSLAQVAEGTQMSGYYQSKLITDLMNHLLDQRDAGGDQLFTAREIIDYFQQGFNIAVEASGATHHRFVPNDLGDGVRWDNHLNWTSDALPTDGDTVDLGGNWVNVSDTVGLSNLQLGTGGKLQVGSGKLSVDTLGTGENGMIFIERAGQFWTDGYDGDALLSLQTTGGRFANTGDFNGPATLHVAGGQVILGTDDARFTLGAGSELRLDGSTAKVGFDGAANGVATLQMQDDGQLTFVADASGMTVLNEFRSGHFDQTGTNVQSGAVLDGTLSIDLSDFVGTGEMKLIELDALAGMFDDVEIHGLGSNRDAELSIDYVTDLVILQLSNGTGQSSLSVSGDPFSGADENATLWEQLTSGVVTGQTQNSSITIFDEAIEQLPDINFI